jgi:hypothetical protein
MHGHCWFDLFYSRPSFDLVVYLITATALGLKVPEAFLLRAEETEAPDEMAAPS